MYPAGSGTSPDPEVVTLMRELQFPIDGVRDWDWGHAVNDSLAVEMKRRVTAGRRDS